MYNYLRLLCYFYIILQVDLEFILENINNQRTFINNFLVLQFVLRTINYLNEEKKELGAVILML